MSWKCIFVDWCLNDWFYFRKKTKTTETEIEPKPTRLMCFIFGLSLAMIVF